MMKWIKLFDFNSYFSAAAVTAAAAVASVGASAYGASEQKKAQEEQAALQEQARIDAKAQEQALFDQRAIDAENSGEATVEFGIDDEDDGFGTYNDFLTPTTPSVTGLGGTKGQTGLMV